MDRQKRRHRTAQIQDQENINAIEGEANVATPTKTQGLTVRGALQDITANVQPRHEIAGKVAVVIAEFEKKVKKPRAAVKNNYSHVQSKVDTGLAAKAAPPQTSSRPPLRRAESTAELASNKATCSKRAAKSIGAHREKDVTFAGLLSYNLNETPPLPADIEDIDTGNNNSPLPLTYIKHIYKHLTQLEEKYPIETDHLRKMTIVTGVSRAILINWLVELQMEFELTLETFQLSVGIIDRYLQAVPNVRRNRLKLVGVTAMLIASKYEEVYAPSVQDFVNATAKAYSKADVLQCEKDILFKLGFSIARPTPLSFLRRFFKAAHGTLKNHHLAKYFVDLCLVDYSMTHYRPSELAAAAICLSLYLLSSKRLDDVWTPTLSYYSGYTYEQISHVIRKLAKIVINVHNSNLYKAVYSKYLDMSLSKVSSLYQLRGEAIRELAKIPPRS